MVAGGIQAKLQLVFARCCIGIDGEVMLLDDDIPCLLAAGKLAEAKVHALHVSHDSC